MFQVDRRSFLVGATLLAQLVLAGACSVREVSPSLSAAASTQKPEEIPDCCKSTLQPASDASETLDLDIPDVELRDQDGRRVRFYSDFVQGKTVAISFFFTSCTTICPPLTAILAQVQRKLLLAGRSDIQLISLSVDPTRDTPPRLKAWSKNFSAKPGWVFLTGKKDRVDRLLKSLRSFTPDAQDHTPMLLIGNEPKGSWRQVNGLASADIIVDALRAMAGKPGKSNSDASAPLATTPKLAASISGRGENESAHSYFGDIELEDQYGKTHRLYTDLMRGRTVLVNSFFSTCAGVCPIMAQKIKEIRKAFAGRVGKDFFVLSISVDPAIDTPTRLSEYAENLRGGSGWYFLTGTQENVEAALHKFGMRVDGRENHSNLFLIGNDKTETWKKVFSLAPTEELIPLVAEVLGVAPSSSTPTGTAGR